jgi:putative ABC transport system permease protein
MSAFVPVATGRPGLALALRFAGRELRSGLAGFRIFIACIALGVAAIAAVGSTTRAITAGIAAEGGVILGGDMAFSFANRLPNDEERAYLQSLGETSEIATLRAMARTPGVTAEALVEVKAVDDAYPLTGAVTLSAGDAAPPTLETALTATGDTFGALVDPVLLARMELAVGDRIEIGRAGFTITGVIEDEPDKVGNGIDFGPRVIISREALTATDLVQPGSLVRWATRVKLPEPVTDAEIATIAEDANERFPEAGWRISTRDNARDGLQRTIARFAQFLTLVGLTALVVGGVGVTNAVRVFLDSRRESIATLKSVGAPGGFVVAVYLAQILVITAIGVVLGLVLGVALPFIGGDRLSEALDIPIRVGVYPLELALAALYGVLTALAFALWSLGRAHDVPVSALFRDRVAPQRRRPRLRYQVATIVMAVGLCGLAVLLAYDRRVAIWFVAAAAGAFLLLTLVAHGIMALARRAPAVSSTPLRLAIRNIHRPGGLTLSVVLSLGLGLALLVTLALIDGNLRRQLASTIPEQAPSFFFLDLSNETLPGFETLVGETAPGGTLDVVPMLRGRVERLGETPVADATVDPDVAWVIEGERGVTYSAEVPENSSVAAGEWWPADYAGEPLVSLEDEVATGLGLAVGDMISVNVLGRSITARIANTRHLEWESFGINFVLVFSPNTFAGAPHMNLATLALPAASANLDTEVTVLKAVVGAFPTVTAVRVSDVLSAVDDLVTDLAIAVRAAASVALVASVLVLAGALAAGHRQRIYDAVLLKTFGATRRRILGAFLAEYAILGLATAVFGLIAGALAGWAVVAGLMDLDFVMLPSIALATVAGALLLTVGLGLLGTWRILGRKAAPVLRNL